MGKIRSVNIHEAKTRLSRLVEEAAEGREIIIAKAGRPRARLVPCTQPCKPRVLGQLKGKIQVSDDFDAPLPNALLRAFGTKR